MINKIEIFERVKKHLLSQGELSYDEPSDMCRYRQEGKMCAIGSLIDDAHYTEALEGREIFNADVINALIGSGIDIEVNTLRSRNAGMKREFYYEMDENPDIDFLTRLQYIHDSSNVDDWSDVLEEFKKEYM